MSVRDRLRWLRHASINRPTLGSCTPPLTSYGYHQTAATIAETHQGALAQVMVWVNALGQRGMHHLTSQLWVPVTLTKPKYLWDITPT
jgi:hypothetical protein